MSYQRLKTAPNTILCFTFIFTAASCSFLKDETHDVFGSFSEGLMAAFGDFNADKNTDIFVIDKTGKSVGIYFQDTDSFDYKNLTTVDDGNVTSVVPGDFDDDVQMDLLLTVSTTKDYQKQLAYRVYWGKTTHSVEDNFILVDNDTFTDQPLVFDWNGNMAPDILAQKGSGRYIYKENGRLFNAELWDSGTNSTFRYPHSNAFLDVAGDYVADLSLTIKNDQIEFWKNDDGEFKNPVLVNIPSQLRNHVVGQISFSDLKREGEMMMLLPVCEDDDCETSAIWACDAKHCNGDDDWDKLRLDLHHDGRNYSFIPPKENIGFDKLRQVFPITLHFADFNMDGYPDIATIMRYRSGHNKYEQRVVLMFNEECHSCPTGRKLEPQWDSKLDSRERAIQVAFFDLYEDGILDILVVSLDDKDVPSISAFENDLDEDACFLKILVVSGKCKSHCPKGRDPYGVNQPGPSITYKMQHTIGHFDESAAAQLSQSAHFALQLPYTLFGLGQTPNFVEEITVGIPTPKHKSDRKRTWTQIIPNSHIIVIPHPRSKPDSWSLELYLTPSKFVYITGFTLLGTCVVCAVIVGVLQLLERREDKVEKQQQSQHFHFDAM